MFNSASNQLVNILKEKMDISIYFQRNVPEEDILRIRDELIGNEKIAKIEYISQEGALEAFE
ncbi:MAG: hypothetical protein HQ538_00230, partial [Parcubacteria group bacterium]|nr:hypothetical protein [Parcubacteria group bacterium]